jgi:hypothetical protein
VAVGPSNIEIDVGSAQCIFINGEALILSLCVSSASVLLLEAGPYLVEPQETARTGSLLDDSALLLVVMHRYAVVLAPNMLTP